MAALIPNPDTFQRCDDNAYPPDPIVAFLMACWLEGEALEFEGERYRAVWHLNLGGGEKR